MRPTWRTGPKASKREAEVAGPSPNPAAMIAAVPRVGIRAAVPGKRGSSLNLWAANPTAARPAHPKAPAAHPPPGGRGGPDTVALPPPPRGPERPDGARRKARREVVGGAGGEQPVHR